MKLVVLICLLYSAICESRVAYSESDVQTGVADVTKEGPVKLQCTFRTLNGGDPYPSVIVRWHDRFHALTWDSEKKEVFRENYKHPTASHSYPGGSGLSGGESTVTQELFNDATVVPDNFSQEDIIDSFRKDCVRPY
ncbi:unnamed protein product [Diatraea saccharalis]|uniref:Uncharacterized protein n=1 Tax=Diatraea saccharalis TaxID=40085 RepID=A0A9N9R0P1_9NEOP|nr:unnamed protein product [Diatraea saccharalis]